MDYLKAIELMNTAPYSCEIMETVYMVTRLHIPERVYKYYSLTENSALNNIKLNTLLENKIYLADANTFNDPFESKAFYYRSHSLAKHDSLRQWDGKLVDDFSLYVRLSSLTSIGINSMPMWAHYTNNHCGYCVEYNTEGKENLSLTSSLFPVQYIDKRIDITPIMESVVRELELQKTKAMQQGEKEIIINNLILVWISIYYSCLKHVSWEYEKELRVVTSSENTYTNAMPSKIYIGAKCSTENVNALVSIAKTLKIPIFQMYFDEYSPKYELLPQEIQLTK